MKKTLVLSILSVALSLYPSKAHDENTGFLLALYDPNFHVCHDCTNDATPWMIGEDINCTDDWMDDWNKCHWHYWKTNDFCELSCYEKGYGGNCCPPIEYAGGLPPSLDPNLDVPFFGPFFYPLGEQIIDGLPTYNKQRDGPADIYIGASAGSMNLYLQGTSPTETCQTFSYWFYSLGIEDLDEGTYQLTATRYASDDCTGSVDPEGSSCITFRVIDDPDYCPCFGPQDWASHFITNTCFKTTSDVLSEVFCGGPSSELRLGVNETACYHSYSSWGDQYVTQNEFAYIEIDDLTELQKQDCHNEINTLAIPSS